MDVSQNQLSVRDARAHFAELITRAQGGTPTIITRNGQPVAAIVPIEDFNALEDAIDRYFAREADRAITGSSTRSWTSGSSSSSWGWATVGRSTGRAASRTASSRLAASAWRGL
jgi:prevent-host-death family protein